MLQNGSKGRGPRLRVAFAAAVAVVSFPLVLIVGQASSQEAPIFPGPVARADCGPGSDPEPGIQGRVPLEDRKSGRSKRGYRCNMELVGQFQGEGATWVNQSYKDCAYMATRFPSALKSPGVQVLDVSDPARPTRVGNLTTPAMLGPWETLKVNEERGLLAAVSSPSPAGNGAGFFDIYDIKTDCKRPRLLKSLSALELTGPGYVFGHEGDFTPDGRTYWASGGLSAGALTAIDIVEPTKPRVVFTGSTNYANHGFGFSPDGNRLYIANLSGVPAIFAEYIAGVQLQEIRATEPPNGVEVFDVSEVQGRTPSPAIRQIGRVAWRDGITGQHAIHITYRGRPHLVWVDEGGTGSVRLIDIADERRPRVISKLKLEIQMPEHQQLRARDTGGTGSPFGYDSHYCAVDRKTDPTALACGFFNSGVRVFDIRGPRSPKEIAYFNPPAQTGRNRLLPGSEHANGLIVGLAGLSEISADWCSSPPRFVGGQLWVTCQDNGFMTLRFTNGSYPLGQCLEARPTFAGRGFGPVALGGARKGQREKLGARRRSERGGVDTYCLEPGGTLRVAYPTAKLRRAFRGTKVPSGAVAILTDGGGAAVRGVRVGDTVRVLRKRLKGERRVRVGSSTWYRTSAKRSRLVFRTSGGRVTEVGIADKRLTRDGRALRRLLTNLGL